MQIFPPFSPMGYLLIDLMLLYLHPFLYQLLGFLSSLLLGHHMVSFFELGHNPFKKDSFNPKEYIAIPFEIGAWNILCYIHKTPGYIEIEPGLLNLFPYSKTENVTQKQVDGIFVLGCPNSDMDDLGYFHDKENG